jgi:hypothetical protein
MAISPFFSSIAPSYIPPVVGPTPFPYQVKLPTVAPINPGVNTLPFGNQPITPSGILGGATGEFGRIGNWLLPTIKTAGFLAPAIYQHFFGGGGGSKGMTAAAAAAAKVPPAWTTPPIKPGVTGATTKSPLVPTSKGTTMPKSLATALSGGGGYTAQPLIDLSGGAAGIAGALRSAPPIPTGLNVTDPNSAYEQYLFSQAAGADFNPLDFMGDASKAAYQSVAPTIASILAGERQGIGSVTGYSLGAQQALRQLASLVGGNYSDAINMQRDIANATGQSLESQSPAGAFAGLLAARGAPVGQSQEVANAGQTGFGLGGARLAGIGQIPADTLAAERPVAMQQMLGQIAPLQIGAEQAIAGVSSGAGAALAKVAQEEGTLTEKYAAEAVSGNEAKAKDLTTQATALMTRGTAIVNAAEKLQAAGIAAGTARYDAGIKAAVDYTKAGEVYNASVAATNERGQAAAAKNRVDYFNAYTKYITATNPQLKAASATSIKDWQEGVYGKAVPVTTTTNKSGTGTGGVPTSSSSQSIKGGGLSYQQTLQYALSTAPAGMTPQEAKQFVDSFTPVNPTANGRPPFGTLGDPNATAALQRAGLTGEQLDPYANKVNGYQANPNGGTPITLPFFYLDHQQFNALASARVLPAGQQEILPDGTRGYVISPTGAAIPSNITFTAP